MFITTFLCVLVIKLSPALSDSDIFHRSKRSDEYVPCERGWYYFRDKCYKAGGRKASERLSWTRALARCKGYGADLVSIQSQEEQDFVIAFLQLDVKFFSWTGLNDRDNESDYKWTDGSVFNYTNWNAMEPTDLRDEKEDCIHLLFEPGNDIIGKWNDKSCDATGAYICEMKANPRKRSPNLMYCSAEEGGGWKYQGSCYHLVTEMQTWQNAERYCKNNYNGHLLTIRDKLEDLFLELVLPDIKKELWIGIKIQEQFQQKWTSGWYVSYDGFNKDETDFIEGTCVARKKRKDWITIPCSKKLAFICETSKATPPVLKPPPRDAQCPRDLDDWRDLGGEYCYYIETENPRNFYEASFHCKRRGGEMVSLHSKEEADILQPFIKYTKRWGIFIGLIRLLTNNEETFGWSDGSPVDYENWNHNEPDNEQEKCVEAEGHHMGWKDVPCENSWEGYICKVKKIIPSIKDDETAGCSSHFSLKTLIGVSVCIFLVIILLGVVVYYFRPCGIEFRKNSTASSSAPPSPSTNRPKYRLATEITVKDDEHYANMT